MTRASALNHEQAVAIRRALIDAGLGKEQVRVRNRSWDLEGLWFAVDVTEKGETTKLYTQAQADEYLANLKPIDVVPYAISTSNGRAPIYQFRVPGATRFAIGFLQAPDGSYWFDEIGIKAIKGLIKYQGKTYRLGKQEFVPFVK